MILRSLRSLGRLRADATGAALVELALALPLLLVLFAATLDGGRTLLAYQTAVAGVRDATRYLGRATPLGGCPAALPAGVGAELLGLVAAGAQGASVTPSGVRVLSVAPSLACDPLTGGYRGGPVSVATVTATIEITLPFSGILRGLFGHPGTVTATLADSMRVTGS